jgi:4-amino-4-deoxy-L-arabinose transferase-like glycosyltransferase
VTRLPWREIAVVAAVALAVRLVVGLLVARQPQGLHDPLLYQGFARHLADGDGYRGLLGEPTAYYPPGYPLFLGVVQRAADVVGLGDHLPQVAAVVQAGLGAVAAAATVVAGRHMSSDPARSRRIAVVAGLVVALWPGFVVYSGVLLSETLFVALFAVTVACALELGDLRRPRIVPVVVGALSFGLAALVRPQVLVAVPFVAVAWWLAGAGWRRALAGAGVAVLGAVVCIAPWTVRNAVVMGHLVPISTNGGDNLCIGFHDDATGGYDYGPECETEGSYVDGADVEVAREAVNRDRAVDWILANPVALPALSAKKLWNTFSNDGDGLRAVESYEDDRFLPDGVRDVLGPSFQAVYLLILAGAVGGAVVLVAGPRRRAPGPLLLLAFTLAGLVVPVMFFGDPRFKVAMVPCLALLAACAVDALVAWRRSDPDRASNATAGSRPETVGAEAADG